MARIFPLHHTLSISNSIDEATHAGIRLQFYILRCSEESPLSQINGLGELLFLPHAPYVSGPIYIRLLEIERRSTDAARDRDVLETVEKVDRRSQ